MFAKVVLCVFCLTLYRISSASSPRLIFANRSDIRILQTNGGTPNVTVVVKNLEDAIALDFDYEQNYVFWTDVLLEKIKRARIFGNNTQEDVISVGLKRPEGLAVDWCSKKLYWTDSEVETNRIEVSNMDGRFRKVLFWENLGQPRAIAVDPASGYMFWTDWGEEPKIERAGMDGTQRTVIVSKDIFWPNGLTIDHNDKRIYWTDAKQHHIATTDFNGKEKRTIIRGTLPHPFAVSLYGNKLYWTDWTTKSIHSCNKKTGFGRLKLQSNVYSPMGIHVFEKARQDPLPKGCGLNNGGCSHLCLLSPQGISCACPTGVRLLLDNKTCENGPKHFLLLARRTDLRRISLDTPDHTDVVLPFVGIKHGIAVDFDPIEEYIYWSDDTLQVIKRAHIDGKGVETVASVEVQNPEGIAVDWIARNLYWTDTGMDRIEVSRLNGTSRKILISEDLWEPRAIVVDPGKGHMYWTDWGEHPKIERADLDGGNRIILVNSSVTWPNGLTIDYSDNKIYWADAKLDKIEVMDVDGSNRRVVLDSNIRHVFGLTLLGNYLYWTDWERRNIDSVNKFTGREKRSVVEQLPDLQGLKAINMSITYGSNPCQTNNGGCSHLCLYRPAGVVCGCPNGMELIKDQLTCIVPRAFLLFSGSHDIHRISLDTYSGGKDIPLVGIKEANALDFSIEEKRIYWTDITLKSINRAYLNGSNPEKLIIVDLEYPDGLAVDWIAKNLYWTDSRKHKIEVSRLDGQHRRTLLYKDVWEPRSLTLDPVNGHLYWANGGQDSSIDRANMDGSNRTKVISNVKRPTDITIDYKEGLLFWADSERKVIECADLHGRNRRTVAQATKPFALTQYLDYIYWTDWETESIERANKTTGLNRTRIRSRVDYVMDITVFHSSRQEGWNVCSMNNGGCSHLCLARPNKQKTCACPMHFKLMSDNRTCQEPLSFMLYSTVKGIHRFIFDSTDYAEISLPLRKLHDVKAVSYDISTGFVYWIDAVEGTIRRALENGSLSGVIVAGPDVEPYDLAIDPYGQQMFWTDAVRNEINVFSLKKMAPLGVVASAKDEMPRSIVLFPEKGLMFWTDVGKNGPKILRASMDGSFPQPIVSNIPRSPVGLAVDTDRDKLYWTDTAHKKIEFSDLQGAKRTVLVDTNLLTPIGLAIHGDFVYWIDSRARVLKRVRREVGSDEQTIQAEIDVTDLVALDRSQISGTVPHPCKQNDCSHICLIGRDNAAKCSCTGSLVLQDDEKNCGEPSTCKPNYISCASMKAICIPKMWRCDGMLDCTDKSDEEDCPPCKENQFRCDNGQCIDGDPRCDKYKNCTDGSDELGCATCEPNFFRCNTGKCISARWQCDQLDDCGDNSDEIGCDTPPGKRIVASIVFCIFLFFVTLLVWRRVKRTPHTLSTEIGLVVTPVLHGHASSLSSSSSSRASICAALPVRNGSTTSGSNKRQKPLPGPTSLSGTSQTPYDRNHLTGASSSSSACTVISAYPREPLNPPPSPATERSLFTVRSRGYCESVMTPSTCPSHRYYRTPRMPPPPTPASTDAEGSVKQPSRHCRRSHRCRPSRGTLSRYNGSVTESTDLAYESDLFAPPPTPNTNYLSEATHLSDQECPPSPTATERSFFQPYPPPPSPVTETPSLV
ncbi:predicted protein [Nematostella vectensis]|uniref:EGF-like domain-containing protein n=1 Tax=Nematostella vectensis TaxID=45351 RepID=A7RGY8_NEMVE|nr:predicted protein [Nematostella vectensis]|eukprot:XP_001641196.1 predicted protein [Nematostella vectensis]